MLAEPPGSSYEARGATLRIVAQKINDMPHVHEVKIIPEMFSQLNHFTNWINQTGVTSHSDT